MATVEVQPNLQLNEKIAKIKALGITHNSISILDDIVNTSNTYTPEQLQQIYGESNLYFLVENFYQNLIIMQGQLNEFKFKLNGFIQSVIDPEAATLPDELNIHLSNVGPVSI